MFHASPSNSAIFSESTSQPLSSRTTTKISQSDRPIKNGFLLFPPLLSVRHFAFTLLTLHLPETFPPLQPALKQPLKLSYLKQLSLALRLSLCQILSLGHTFKMVRIHSEIWLQASPATMCKKNVHKCISRSFSSHQTR